MEARGLILARLHPVNGHVSSSHRRSHDGILYCCRDNLAHKFGRNDIASIVSRRIMNAKEHNFSFVSCDQLEGHLNFTASTFSFAAL